MAAMASDVRMVKPIWYYHGKTMVFGFYDFKIPKTEDQSASVLITKWS